MQITYLFDIEYAYLPPKPDESAVYFCIRMILFMEKENYDCTTTQEVVRDDDYDEKLMVASF